MVYQLHIVAIGDFSTFTSAISPMAKRAFPILQEINPKVFIASACLHLFSFLIGESNPSTVTLTHSLIILQSTQSSTNRHKLGPETRTHQPYYPIYHF